MKFEDLYRAKLMNLKTGATFSANAGDYWDKDEDFEFGKDMALVVERPVEKKGDIIGGTKIEILKKNPTVGDLVDQTYPPEKSKQLWLRKKKKKLEEEVT